MANGPRCNVSCRKRHLVAIVMFHYLMSVLCLRIRSPLPGDDGLVGGLADLGLPVAQPFSDDHTGCAEAGQARHLVGLVRHDPQRQSDDAAHVVPWCTQSVRFLTFRCWSAPNESRRLALAAATVPMIIFSPDARITPSAATIGRTQALTRLVGGPVVWGSDRALWLRGSGGTSMYGIRR